MAKTVAQSDYTNTLVQLRDDLADNLTTKGVPAQRTEKFNTLVPKVLEIETGGRGGAPLTTEPKFVAPLADIQKVQKKLFPRLVNFSASDCIEFDYKILLVMSHSISDPVNGQYSFTVTASPDYLIAFSKSGFIVYHGATQPASMTLEDTATDPDITEASGSGSTHTTIITDTANSMYVRGFTLTSDGRVEYTTIGHYVMSDLVSDSYVNGGDAERGNSSTLSITVTTPTTLILGVWARDTTLTISGDISNWTLLTMTGAVQWNEQIFIYTTKVSAGTYSVTATKSYTDRILMKIFSYPMATGVTVVDSVAQNSGFTVTPPTGHKRLYLVGDPYDMQYCTESLTQVISTPRYKAYIDNSLGTKTPRFYNSDWVEVVALDIEEETA